MTYRVLPVDYDTASNKLSVALDTASNFRATDDLRTLLGFEVEALITDAEGLAKGLERYYGDSSESINELIGELETDSQLNEFQGRDASIDLDDLSQMADSRPVMKLLNVVLMPSSAGTSVVPLVKAEATFIG